MENHKRGKQDLNLTQIHAQVYISPNNDHIQILIQYNINKIVT